MNVKELGAGQWLIIKVGNNALSVDDAGNIVGSEVNINITGSVTVQAVRLNERNNAQDNRQILVSADAVSITKVP